MSVYNDIAWWYGVPLTATTSDPKPAGMWFLNFLPPLLFTDKKKDKKKGKEDDDDVKAEPISKISDYKLIPFEIEDTIRAVADVDDEPVKAVEKPVPEKYV